MFRKKYIVTLKKGSDIEHFIHEMTHEDDCDECIPLRAVDISDERPLSLRSTEFELTDQEALELKNHPDVYSVDLNPGGAFKSNFAKQNDLFLRDQLSNPWMTNWGLRRTNLESHADHDISDTYDYVLDGSGVDIVIQDDGVWANHPEFLDENGETRVQEIDWYEEIGWGPGNMPEGHYEITDTYHGTHVAGIAAGKTYGFAKGSRLYSIRFDLMPTGHEFDLVRIWHSLKPVDPVTGLKRPTIVNASWGYSWYIPGYGDEDTNSITDINYRGNSVGTTVSSDYKFSSSTMHGFTYGYIDAACQDMIDAGVIFVCAAGNTAYKLDITGGQDYNNYYTAVDGWPMGSTLYPAGSPIYYNRPGSPHAENAIIVGNVDLTTSTSGDWPAATSERGPAVNIWAPGSQITSAGAPMVPGDLAFNFLRLYSQYRDYPGIYNLRIGGTSMASPQVTGLLALFLQLNPHATQEQCLAWLQNHASRNTLNDTGTDNASDSRSLLGSNPKLLFNPFNTSDTMAVNKPQDSATFSLAQTDKFLDEHGQEVNTITLQTTNVPDGTVVPYRIFGLESNDIKELLVGTFELYDNTASTTVTANRDFSSDGIKTAKLVLKNRKAATHFFINDSSLGEAYARVTNITGLNSRGSIVEGTQLVIDIEAFGFGSSEVLNLRWYMTGSANGADIQPYASLGLPETFVLTPSSPTKQLVWNVINESNDFFNEAGEAVALTIEQQLENGSYQRVFDNVFTIEQPPVANWTFDITFSNVNSEGKAVEGSYFTLVCQSDDPSLTPSGTRIYYRTNGNAQPAGQDYNAFGYSGSLVVTDDSGSITVNGRISPDPYIEGQEAAIIQFFSNSGMTTQIGQVFFYIVDNIT